MPKKINKELKALVESQIEVEGFDYAMVEKIGPNDWEEGIVPEDLNGAWLGYLSARTKLKEILRTYGIDPQ